MAAINARIYRSSKTCSFFTFLSLTGSEQFTKKSAYKFPHVTNDGCNGSPEDLDVLCKKKVVECGSLNLDLFLTIPVPPSNSADPTYLNVLNLAPAKFKF